MKVKLKEVLIMLLMATLAAADPENAASKIETEEILPYPYILTGVCCIMMMLIVLYLHVRIPQIRAIYGWALPSFLAGLITVFFSFVMMNTHVEVIPFTVLGYTIGFGTIVCICWFNVMCYDCYAVFSGRARSTAKYSLYGWGLPGAYLALCLVLESVPIEHKYQPPFAHWGYEIVDEYQTADMLYFFLPMTLLMVVNIVLLVKTKMKINKIVNQPEDTIRTDTKLDHERFGLTVLIFIAMVISFGMDMFSWAMKDYEWLYFMSNVSVYMLGVVIFFLFICNRHVDQWCARSPHS